MAQQKYDVTVTYDPERHEWHWQNNRGGDGWAESRGLAWYAAMMPLLPGIIRARCRDIPEFELDIFLTDITYQVYRVCISPKLPESLTPGYFFRVYLNAILRCRHRYETHRGREGSADCLVGSLANDTQVFYSTEETESWRLEYDSRLIDKHASDFGMIDLLLSLPDERHRAVAQLLADGYRQHEIAAIFGVERTRITRFIHNHLRPAVAQAIGRAS